MSIYKTLPEDFIFMGRNGTTSSISVVRGVLYIVGSRKRSTLELSMSSSGIRLHIEITSVSLR